MFNAEIAFGSTVSKLNNLPILKVNNLLDYSVADQYEGQYPYIWLQNKRMDIRDDFNWSWRPEQFERNLVHCFPVCNAKTQQPINWNALKLVSTSPAMRLGEKTQTIPAKYTLENYTIVFVSTDANRDRAVVEFHRQQLKFENARLYTGVDSIRSVLSELNPDVLTDHIFLFDINTNIDDFINPDIDIDNALVFCMTNHRSNGIDYADGNAVYIHKRYLKQYLQNQHRLDICVLDTHVFGVYNDCADPYKAWVNAYSNTVQMELVHELYNDRVKQRILSSYLDDYNYYLTKQVFLDNGKSTVGANSRLQSYIKDGCQTALADIKQYINDVQHLMSNYRSASWLRQRFDQRQIERLSKRV